MKSQQDMLKEIRQLSGLSFSQIARAVGVSPRTITRTIMSRTDCLTPNQHGQLLKLYGLVIQLKKETVEATFRALMSSDQGLSPFQEIVPDTGARIQL